MYVPVTVFTDKDDKRKETGNDATKHHHKKEKSNITKNKVQDCELDIDRRI